MGEIEAALAELTFERHFIECLGWDRVRDQFIPAFPLETLSRRCTRPPTDPASVEAMTDSYRSPTTATRKPPTDPVSVEAMTGSYRTRNRTPKAPHRPRVGGGHDWQLWSRSTSPQPSKLRISSAGRWRSLRRSDTGVIWNSVAASRGPTDTGSVETGANPVT